MVFISMNQDINLVAEDYYRQEIAYEDQINRERNTSKLEKAPTIKLDRSNQLVIVEFPVELISKLQEGNIHMFRPSDSNLDKRFRLNLNEEGIQAISISGQPKGLWRIKLLWRDTNLEYYQEQILNY